MVPGTNRRSFVGGGVAPLATSPLRKLVMEGMLVMRCQAREGMPGRAPGMILRAIACTGSGLVPPVLLRVVLIPMLMQWDRIGWITAV